MFTFCKPVSSKKRFLPFRTLNEDFSFTLYEKADALLKKDWNAINKGECFFLETAYLNIIERCLHTKLSCRYVIVYYRLNPCGIIYFQIADFKAEVFGDLLTSQIETFKSKRMNLFEKYVDSNKDEVLLRLFTCGNNLVSGEYGFVFDKKIKTDSTHTILLQITDIVSKEDKLKGTISATLIKDFHQSLQPKKLFKNEKYTEFFVEPNLVINIPEGVDSIDSYIELFSKKYRNRAKSIFKNLAGIEIRELNVETTQKHEAELYQLYENIFDKAKFKLNKLPSDYFSQVKAIFPHTFHIKAFFLNSKIVAFGSCFTMPDMSLEAHYIGFEYDLNTQYNLYQNLLYSMIEKAIKNKCIKVNLGRTAAEIKTTVGAVAEELVCYIKPQNTISKFIQKPFIEFLQPSEWIPRNPFKEKIDS
jgi:predicted N-acyltransferase